MSTPAPPASPERLATVGPARSRKALFAVIGFSVLLHLFLLYILGGVPLGIGASGEDANESVLELAPDAQARAQDAPVREEMPRPRPEVAQVTLPVVQFRRPDALSVDPTELFREVPSAVAVPLSPTYGAGRPGAYGKFEDMIDEMRRHGLDVVLAIDTTGSMDWVIEEVRERIDDLVGVVRGFVPKTRFGIVAYRDFDSAYVTKIQPLTYQTRKLERFLGQLRAEGGGDVFEALEPAIVESIEKTGFRDDSYRVVIVVGDAPPHPENMLRLIKRVRRFKKQGGVVSLLDVSLRSNPEVLRRLHGMEGARSSRHFIPEYQELASAGGGEVANLKGTSRVARNIAVAIFGSQWREWLLPYLGGLE